MTNKQQATLFDGFDVDPTDDTQPTGGSPAQEIPALRKDRIHSKSDGYREYMLPTCDDHAINPSFARAFAMPKRVRGWAGKCSRKGCSRDATRWLVVDLSEAVFGYSEEDPKWKNIREGKP